MPLFLILTGISITVILIYHFYKKSNETGYSSYSASQNHHANNTTAPRTGSQAVYSYESMINGNDTPPVKPIDAILSRSDVDNYVNQLQDDRAKEIIILMAKYHDRMMSHIDSPIVKNEDLQTWGFLWGEIRSHLWSLDVILGIEIDHDITDFFDDQFTRAVFDFIRNHAEFYKYYFDYDNEEPRFEWVIPSIYPNNGRNLIQSMNAHSTMKIASAYFDFLINPQFSEDGEPEHRYRNAAKNYHDEILLYKYATTTVRYLLRDIINFLKELDKYKDKWSIKRTNNSESTVKSANHSFVDKYHQHFPRIRSVIADYFEKEHFKSDIDTELKCFMYFLSMILSTPAHLGQVAELYEEISKDIPEDIINNRYSVYTGIVLDGKPARADWRLAISQIEYARHPEPIVRALVAFVDFLINPNCAEDYYTARPNNYILFIFTDDFNNFVNDQLFIEIVQYSKEFPSPIHYQGE
jgi:hypothetical protein